MNILSQEKGRVRVLYQIPPPHQKGSLASYRMAGNRMKGKRALASFRSFTMEKQILFFGEQVVVCVDKREKK